MAATKEIATQGVPMYSMTGCTAVAFVSVAQSSEDCTGPHEGSHDHLQCTSAPSSRHRVLFTHTRCASSTLRYPVHGRPFADRHPTVSSVHGHGSADSTAPQSVSSAAIASGINAGRHAFIFPLTVGGPLFLDRAGALQSEGASLRLLGNYP
jgi:hypothetical protein|eukprot:COSAG03_NODE_12_length_22635_cov_7.308307_5_plen_152_part_00